MITSTPYQPLPQALDLSHNPELKTVPSEVGWLPLSRLDIDGNPNLRMPKIVIERGFRCEEGRRREGFALMLEVWPALHE